MIGITRTNSVKHLANLYSIADVFVNPTVEDNYSTTNLETIASGTPVITYKTGGSPESAVLFGTTVKENTVENIKDKIAGLRPIPDKRGCVTKDKIIEQYLNYY